MHRYFLFWFPALSFLNLSEFSDIVPSTKFTAIHISVTNSIEVLNTSSPTIFKDHQTHNERKKVEIASNETIR